MDSHHISVIFSTYNRSEYLRQTLEAMCKVDREGLKVEFVAVDNNSKDDTAQVIDSFLERLPLRHLFESRPGKNCALNHALDTIELGEIVVFTDDDVVPRLDWLKKIWAACERWLEYDVFGGKIDLVWPVAVEIPKWARENVMIRRMGFGEHDLGTEAKPYEGDNCPLGANFWVRRNVFSGGMRYAEGIGPRPGKSFGMGSETEFLLRLAAGGRRPLYVEDAAVGHHVPCELLVPQSMLKRAIRSGRGKAHTAGPPEPEDLMRRPWRWRLRRLAAMARSLDWRLRAQLHRDECIRMKNAVEALRSFAYHREALSMSWKGKNEVVASNSGRGSNDDCAMAQRVRQSPCGLKCSESNVSENGPEPSLKD